MDPSKLFSFANGYASISWIALFLLYENQRMPRIIAAASILPLCLLYAILLIPGLGQMDPSAFSTLEGVSGLFSQPEAVLVGWIHYLAFDLLTGMTIAISARNHGLSRWVLIPVFFFTFMLGPVGFLMYYILLSIKKKEWAPALFG